MYITTCVFTCWCGKLHMEITRWLHELTLGDSLELNAVVCLLTPLVAPCRSEQLTADSDEKCWKRAGRGRTCMWESLQGIWANVLPQYLERVEVLSYLSSGQTLSPHIKGDLRNCQFQMSTAGFYSSVVKEERNKSHDRISMTGEKNKRTLPNRKSSFFSPHNCFR